MQCRRLRTSRLDIAYLEAGPPDGLPVLLLHGFPDDATGWSSVMQLLAGRGRRAIAPFARGCGGTRFLSPDTPRAGDFAALGRDGVELVDALGLRDLTVVGQDWGSPTAEIVAMERPEVVRRLVKLNWYGVYTMVEMSRAGGFHYPQLRTLWYLWMLNTSLGEMALRCDREGLARALWAEWSPSWDPELRERAMGSVVASFHSDDWVRVALSAYRNGFGAAEADPEDAALRSRLADPRPLACATVILTGADDGVERTPLDAAALDRWFTGGVSVRTLAGVGHFPHREAPAAVASVALD